MPDQPGFFARLGPHVLKYRWIIMAGIGLLAVFLEVYERIQLHDLQLDFSFFFEAFFEGVIIPVLGGFLLSLVERATQERYRVVNQLANKQALTQAINNAQHWPELLKIIAEFPRSTLPLVGSVLLVNEPGTSQFKPEVFWGLHGINPDTYANCYPTKVCEACSLNRVAGSLKLCDCEDGLPPENIATRFCLPLVHANQVVALLQLYLSPNTKVTDDQSKILATLAPEMALAIDNARSKRMNVLLKESNDAELRRISRDLHDNLAQSLIYVRHKLDQMAGENALGEITNLRKDLERMRQVVDDAYIDVRSTLKELESSVLTDLSKMLQDYGLVIEDRNGFKIHFHTNGQPQPVPTHLARQILAIFGEILANIEKHSGARNVEVRLDWERDSLTLTVVDDGRGFEMHNPNGSRSNGHLGLAILQDRAKELNGTLTILSAEGRGTTVTAWLPVSSNVKELHNV
jgi:signal transduction histidine kinase